MNRLLTSIVLLGIGTITFAQSEPYKNPELSAHDRAVDLCSRLTLEEKTLLMMDVSPAIERLGISEFHWWNEALHGVGRNGCATVFPATIGMAASFDSNLLYDIFTAVSDEARAKNTLARQSKKIKRYQGLSFWTPNINIFRDPRWGRGQETYGEDPYLTSKMGLAVVKGLQGPENSKYRKLLACAKHFAVHSGPESSRHSFNIQSLPERDLWETYLPAFKSLVQEGHVAEVMCAYQSIDNEPCCGNNRYLQQILRNEWGYKNIVVSDCGAIGDFWKQGCHEFVNTGHEAAGIAVRRGTDLECGSVYKALPEAVAKGEVTMAEIDSSLVRLLKARFELGDFDPDADNQWTKIPMSVVASKKHKKLARQMAQESIVLLHNRNKALPLSKDATDIVVMGPNANDSVMQWGNYNGFPTKTYTILEGIREKVGNVRYIKGCNYTKREFDETKDSEGNVINKHELTDKKILEQTGNVSTVIFVGGISPSLEGEEMHVNEPGFEGGDRTSIELPDAQRKIIELLHNAGKKVIFVNCSGSAVALVPETYNADAILQAWYPGEEGGRAVADVVFGDYNPSGKLPVTFYRSDDDLPDFDNYEMKNRTYRYFKGKPLFDFGYGMSYTTFKIKSQKTKNNKIRVNIKNTGNMKGAETVQLYIKRENDIFGPNKTLRGFQRVTLSPGESKVLEFDCMSKEVLECWDESTNTMRVVPGTYKIMVGTSSRDIDLKNYKINIQ